MKGVLLVALLVAGSVLAAAKIDKTAYSLPTIISANLNPAKPVSVELKRTRQASLLEQAILIPVPPIESESSKQNPQKKTFAKEPQISAATRPVLMEPTKLTAKIPVKPAEVPTKPEGIPVNVKEVPAKLEAVSVKPEEVLAKLEEAPVKPKEVPVKPKEVPVKLEEVPVKLEVVPVKRKEVPVTLEVVPAKLESVPVKLEEVPVQPEVVPIRPEMIPVKREVVPATSEIPVVTEVHVESDVRDTEVPVSQPFENPPSESNQYPLPEGVILSPRHGDTPENFSRDELIIPGGNAGNSNEQSGDLAELSIVYTVENNPDEDHNVTRAHEASQSSQPSPFGYSEDQAMCPVPKTAK